MKKITVIKRVYFRFHCYELNIEEENRFESVVRSYNSNNIECVLLLCACVGLR